MGGSRTKFRHLTGKECALFHLMFKKCRSQLRKWYKKIGFNLFGSLRFSSPKWLPSVTIKKKIYAIAKKRTNKKDTVDLFQNHKDWDTTSCVHLETSKYRRTQGGSPSRCGNFFLIWINILYSIKRSVKKYETYSRVDGSVDPSSPSIRYTFPNMTYSKESARDGMPKSCGAHSPASEHPSSRKVVAKTRRNLSPKIKILFIEFISFKFEWFHLNPLERAMNWCRESSPSWMTHSRNGVDSLQYKLRLTINQLCQEKSVFINSIDVLIVH